MRAAVAAMLLLILAGCGSVGAEPASRPVAGKPLPYAPPPPPLPSEPVACPADVRQCPDGSFVSRNPANDCMFDACPGESNK